MGVYGANYLSQRIYLLCICIFIVVFSMLPPVPPLAKGETFTLGLLNGGCWEGGEPNLWWDNARDCSPSDSVDSMVRIASLEVTCHSDLMRIKAPMKLRCEPTGMVRARYNGKLIDMPSSVSMDRFNAMIFAGESLTPDHESRDTWLLERFIDVWVGAPGPLDTDPGGTADCGNVPYYSIPTSCDPMETSEGPIRYPCHGTTAWYPLVEFDVTRKALWDYLRQRAVEREMFDTNQSGKSEASMLKVYLYDVANPAVPTMKDRAGSIRRKDFRHGMPASSWYMLGTVDWNGIAVGRSFDYGPSALHDELNRLQDFYEACKANLPAPDLSGPADTPAVSAARTAVRALRNDSEEWDRWKDLTLEQFAETPWQTPD